MAIPFPQVEVSDLIGMARNRRFLLKRGLQDITAIQAFCIDQLPADVEAVSPPTTPPVLPARANEIVSCEDILANVLPDLEALQAIGKKAHASPAGAAAGLFSGFDFKSLLEKLTKFLPLILTLFAAPSAAPVSGK